MDLNRRMFLRGAAGFTLALPLLPSLLEPRAARAGGGPVVKRFVSLGNRHGGVRQSNMVPDASKLTGQTGYAGQQIRRGQLVDLMTTSGGKTVLSPVLTADSGRLTPLLVSKLNVLRGFDTVPGLSVHDGGAYLGNYADSSSSSAQLPLTRSGCAWNSSWWCAYRSSAEIHGQTSRRKSRSRRAASSSTTVGVNTAGSGGRGPWSG